MNKVILIIITLCFTFSVNAIENEFNGSWELISGEYLNNKGVMIQYEDLKISSIKVISGTHFSFVSMSGDKFWSSGAGSYRFTEKEYIESPIFTSYGAALGKEYVFTYTIKNNTWYNSRWDKGTRVEYEVWRKLSKM
ncbi:MAG TPA: hypothetical protein DEO86_04940 [Colwellia sp.]|nr:hypothetical protein [Colwellia sp.]